MNGSLCRFHKEWDKAVKILRNEDGMSLASVLAAFSVLMVLLVLMTTAVRTAQTVITETELTGRLYEEAEEALFINPDPIDVVQEGLHFLPLNGGAAFSIEEAFLYRTSCSDGKGNTVELYGFAQ